MSGIESKLAELAARFAARAPAERAAIAEALAAGDTQEVIDRAHKLAGIAGMFGHHEVGQAALALEEAAMASEDCAQPGAALLALLDRL
ncbi:Hpt domain-containing protein [Tsuneonella rigui]|uniref:Hpt domain-containing protein n=1 Tax=Tsuneonella rigui TaxID=1708790 RepID=UPI000F7ED5A8|nr:Hpt domain-containing protein [Tsuneonella rigui]